MFVVTCLIGLVTPPVGIILFMTSSIAGVKLEPLSIAVFPFVVWMTIVVILMVFFPPLTLWLPKLIGLHGAFHRQHRAEEESCMKQEHSVKQAAMTAAATFSRCRSPRAAPRRWARASARPAIGQATKTIRFGHMLPTDQIHHKAIVMFGDELAQAVRQQDQGRDLPELAARQHSRRCCSRCRPAR